MNGVDTNVLVYACDMGQAEKRARAIEVLRTVQPCVLLWQVAVEFLAATRKLESSGFTRRDAWDQIETLAQSMTLVVPKAETLNRGRNLHLRGDSFWDAMILASCAEAGITRFYTEDLPGITIPGLEIINPFAG